MIFGNCVPQLAFKPVAAGVKGKVDHFAALSFLRGLLLILKDSGYFGLVLVQNMCCKDRQW